jgi:NADPH:quinone reductase-like Zn-dependent oxidoreductase
MLAPTPDLVLCAIGLSLGPALGRNARGGVSLKAIVCPKYGPPEVLQLKEVEKPVPRNNEVLIRVHATAVTSSDTLVRGFNIPAWHPMGFMFRLMLGFGKPKRPILGLVLAGDVESIGTDVKRFKKGDQVYAATAKSLTKIRFGTFAEYTTLPEDWVIVQKPTNLSYEEAAAIPYGGWLALYFLRRGKLQRGQEVLIVGASGSVGTSAVQLARHLGARVTGVCSTTNQELVKSLGADEVIDYTKEDYSERGSKFDLILDAVPQTTANRKRLRAQAKRALNPNGHFVSVDEGTPTASVEAFIFLKGLCETGTLKPVIDRTYSLEQMVEAHRYVETGRKKGNVVISVVEADKP